MFPLGNMERCATKIRTLRVVLTAPKTAVVQYPVEFRSLHGGRGASVWISEEKYPFEDDLHMGRVMSY